ncbi:MAG TPA: histidine kinase, partial [Allosphingosinicella sp.]|nr:histidine kinase [Allosphingosinicella sp.]
FQPRRRAFQRLDRDGNGALSFEEWAVRTVAKFGEADANRDRALDRTEFAATAPRRRAPARAKGCAC